MSTSFTGTVIDGTVQLDQRVDLADQSRVQVTIVPVEDWRQRMHQALKALDELKATHPISSRGLHFTRDQLYER